MGGRACNLDGIMDIIGWVVEALIGFAEFGWV